MEEVLFALLMFLNGTMIEHTPKDSLSQCLKGKRIAMREKKTTDRVIYQCIKSKAEIEVYMGEKKITKLILE